MPRYVFDVRHLDDLCLEDNPAGVELPDDLAAREFALKVMFWASSEPERRLGRLDDGGHPRRANGLAAPIRAIEQRGRLSS